MGKGSVGKHLGKALSLEAEWASSEGKAELGWAKTWYFYPYISRFEVALKRTSLVVVE